MTLRYLLHEPANQVKPPLLSDMFVMRDAVFRQRLCWDVRERNGLERDCYDLLGATYCLCVDQEEQVLGSWRLLPTVGPNLLKDVFAHLLGGNEIPCGPRVWEASRFAVGTAERAPNGAVSEATAGLIAAMLECGMNFGIERIVAVCDVRFERVLQRSGLRTSRYGDPCRIGNSIAVAGWFSVSEENLALVRNTNGLRNDVLTPPRTLSQAA